MSKMNYQKYVPFPKVSLPDRTWPEKTIQKAPAWCSVDLRDGNQALITPMTLAEKLTFFQLLTDIGFKEIEIGFPSAAQVEYDFARTLIEQNKIPPGVAIQVLTQARPHLIKRTFESLKGAREAILHFYNSTSALQRRVVFRMEKKEILALAVQAAKLIKEEAKPLIDAGTKIRYEYSPESFTGTELDFALEVCESVKEVLAPTKENKLILNLPATVEMSTPNEHADQIEWFSRHISQRDKVLISVHAHNDRGTAVAASELALLAGADRVEGTIFGNGERTGNVDIINLALNMFTHGIDPKLDVRDINKIKDTYEKCNKLPVHMRHPYAGELVFTAFSGSHQDAINKGLKALRASKTQLWEVPYLPIDPADIGRTYEAIIRINSQSGKGGIAYILEQAYGYKLPKVMHPEFGRIIQNIADKTGQELPATALLAAFQKEYLQIKNPIELLDFDVHMRTDGHKKKTTVQTQIKYQGQKQKFTGEGNGPVDAFTNGLKSVTHLEFSFKDYSEHALSTGSDSQAVAYIQIAKDNDGQVFSGAGVDDDISMASIKAVISAVNRAFK